MERRLQLGYAYPTHILKRWLGEPEWMETSALTIDAPRRIAIFDGAKDQGGRGSLRWNCTDASDPCLAKVIDDDRNLAVMIMICAKHRNEF